VKRKLLVLGLVLLSLSCQQATRSRVEVKEAAELQGLVRGPYVSKVTKESAVVFFEVRPMQPSPNLLVRWASAGVVSEQRLGSEGLKHEVELAGLGAGFTYRYEIIAESKDGAKTQTVLGNGAFTTPPDQPRQFRFVVYGDTRTQPQVHRQVCEAIAGEQPAFVIHTGDLVSDGRNLKEWPEQFFGPAAPLLQVAAIYPANGNHEAKSPLFYQYFGLPERKAWYSFTWGNVEVFVVDTEEEYEPDDEQGKWLAGQLSASKATWKIAVHHVPGISSGSHGFNDGVNKHLRPLYERYGVDLVFSGHDHTYERTKPITGEGGDHAVTYVIAGGGGAPLYQLKTGPWTAAACSCHHYVVVEAGLDALHLVTKDRDRQIIDTLTLRKDDPDYKKTAIAFDDLKK